MRHNLKELAISAFIVLLGCALGWSLGGTIRDSIARDAISKYDCKKPE